MRLEPFYLNDWTVYPELNRAQCGSRTVHLEPKIVDVLVYLAERAGSVVSRDDLMSEIWSDTVVLSDSLNRCISQIRSTFESGCEGAKIIETIRKRGYRLVADIRYVDVSHQDSVHGVNMSARSDRRPTNVSFTLATSSISNWYYDNLAVYTDG